MLAERNLGLEKLAGYLNSMRQRPLIVMGDFNTTPWSKAYWQFSRRLGRSFYNPAKGKGLKLSWIFFGLFGAHIDHIIVNRLIRTKEIVLDESLGSDHRLVYADFQI
jgi:endonuclease/exonuclease/phosphatase (EEP) superfamily protein YafD